MLLNDCSIHGQFSDIRSFQDAVERVMTIRKTARQFGRDLQCHRNVANAQVTHELTMPQVVNRLSRDTRSALMQWITRHGPFWEDVRQHTGDDWLEYNGKFVTETAVGEAAYCLLYGIDRGLVSMNPSSWLTSPLLIDWRDNGQAKSVDVLNYWDAIELKAVLAARPVPLESWRDLEVVARSRYPDLTFSSHSFEPLSGHPFGKGAAERLLSRLTILQDIKNCFDVHGRRTPEGHEIYRKHFTGDKAWFSDSSGTEKADFRMNLTFPHPTKPGEFLFCTWHAKVKTPQLRIHFSWPIRASEPFFIVYVGPKITKR